MKAYSSREVIKLLKAAGWYEVHQVGSHVQLKHSSRPGRVTVPHPKQDLPIGTVRAILKASGIDVKGCE